MSDGSEQIWLMVVILFLALRFLLFRGDFKQRAQSAIELSHVGVLQFFARLFEGLFGAWL
jgi:hypothetical protein